MAVTGFIQGFCKSSTGTPAAFAASVTGSYKWDTQSGEKRGTGGQIVRRKGTSKISVDFEATGVAGTDMALWWPTTKGVQVAGFPDFILDDGSTQWILTLCQPGAATLTKAAGESDLLVFKGSIESALATPTSAKTVVYTSLTGYAKSDIVASLGAAQGVNSFEISNGGGTEMVNPMDSKSAGYLTNPKSITFAKYDPSMKAEFSTKLAAAELYGDDYTASVNFVAVCDNGIDKAITITVTDVVQDSFNGPVQADSIVYFSYDLKLNTGNVFNRVQFAVAT